MFKRLFFIILQRIYVILEKVKRLFSVEKKASKILMFHEINGVIE